MTEEWKHALDKSKKAGTICIFMNLSKTFDILNHNLLQWCMFYKLKLREIAKRCTYRSINVRAVFEISQENLLWKSLRRMSAVRFFFK